MGDLNYRIEASRELVIQLMNENNFEKLRSYDQLITQRQNGTVFNDFTESPIEFPPTYKYDPGTNIYDTRYKYRLQDILTF